MIKLTGHFKKSLKKEKWRKARPVRKTSSKPSQSGNVFFTLFGAVALVGVLGAGIMSTMRGPLTTMVEVNRIEQTRAELRLAMRQILLNSTDIDADAFTEPVTPDTYAGGPSGAGQIPSSIGANKNDPWGTKIAYCAWDNGADTSAPGNLLAGGNNGNNITIAMLSAGPDRTFSNTCAADPTYVPALTAGDDIMVALTYAEAASSSGGLWDVGSGGDTAEISLDLDVTGGATFTDVLDLTNANSQLQLGAASLTLPDQTVLTTCNAANVNLLRINTATPTSLEFCSYDGSTYEWQNSSTAGLWQENGSDIYFNTGNVGIGNASPDDPLDVVGNVGITGNVELSSGSQLIWNGTGASIAESSGTLTMTESGGTNSIAIASSGATVTGDTTITGSTTDNTAAGLNVTDSGATSLLFVRNDGNVGIGEPAPNDKLDVAGTIDTTGDYKISGNVVLRAPDTTDDDTILLGNAAGVGSGSNPVTGDENTILGAGAGATLTTGQRNILVGHDVDTLANNTNDYLNIGNVIYANMATGHVGIEISNPNDTLDVGGNIRALTTIDAGTSISAQNNIVAATGDITATAGDIIAGSEFKIGSAIVGPIPECDNDNEKLEYTGTGWNCADITGGTGSGGSGTGGALTIEDILKNGDDANNENLDDLNKIGADEYCEVGLSTCISSAALITAGTGGGSALALLDDDGDTRIQVEESSDEDKIRFDTDGFERMIIDENGYVGIGASSPGPKTYIYDATLNTVLSLESGDNVVSIGMADNNTTDSLALARSGDNLRFYTSGTEAVRIDSSSNVGIGTTSPTSMLTIGTADGLNGGQILLNPMDGSLEGGQIRFEGGGGYTSDDFVLDNYSGRMRFVRTNPGGLEVFSILQDGKVGIGDSSPDTGVGGDGQALLLDVEGPIGGTYFCDADGEDCFTASSVLNSQLWQNDGPGGPTEIYYMADYVGIGTNNPAYNFDVVQTNTDLSGTLYNSRSYMVANPGGATTSAYRANINQVTNNTGNNTDLSQMMAGYDLAQYTGTGTVATTYGQYGMALNSSASGTLSSAYGNTGVAQNSSTGTVTNAYGGYNYSLNASTGTMSNAFGAYNYVLNNSTGTITTARGSYNYVRNNAGATMPTAYGVQSVVENSSTGTITTAHGISAYLTNPSGTVTNWRGLYISDEGSDPNYYSIFTDGTTKSYFGGPVGFGDLTPDQGGDQPLVIDAEGAIGATHYCDQAGSNCFVPTDVSTLASGDLDWDDFTDTMTLDATTTIDMDTNTADLNFDSATLYIDSSANRVGIGTTTPNANLHINRSNYASLLLGNNDSTGYHITKETSDNSLRFWTGALGSGTFRMGLTTDGRLGIGTTSPDSALDVTTSATNDGLEVSDGTVRTVLYSTGGNRGSLWTTSNHDLTFGTNNSEKMRIDVDGNVGIGTTTPAAKLQIQNGEFRISHDDGSPPTIRLDSDVSGGFASQIQFRAEDSGGSIHEYARINSNVDDGTDGAEDGRLTFSTSLAGTLTNNIVITQGNVGIGTTSPGSKLDILTGTASSIALRLSDVDTDTTTKQGRVVQRHYDNSEEDMTLLWGNSGSGNSTIHIGGGSNLYNAATDLVFHTAANNTTQQGTERMRIDENGRVGIGTTSPTAPLTLAAANSHMRIEDTDGGSAGVLQVNASKMFLGNWSDGGFAILDLANNRMGIGTSSPAATLDVTGTDAMILPRGTTAQQPAGGDSVNGMIRYDTDVDKFQAYQAGAWQDILTTASGNIVDDSIDWDKISDAMTLDADTVIDMDSGNFDLTFDDDSNTLHIDSENNRIGIGTNTPGYILDIVGNEAVRINSSADALTINNASVGQHTIRFDNAPLRFYSGDSASEIMRLVGSTGNVGIGTASPSYRLHTYDSSTATSGSEYTSYNQMEANPGSATTATYRAKQNLATAASGNNTDLSELTAAHNYVYYNNTGTVTSSYGASNQLTNNSTGTITNARAAYNLLQNSTTGTITNAHGSYNYVRNSGAGTISSAAGGVNLAQNQGAGDITTAYGNYSQVLNNGTGTITNAYGSYNDLVNDGGGTVTNFRGVYVADEGTDANYYAIYTDGDTKSYFGGNVGIGTTAPGARLDLGTINGAASDIGFRMSAPSTAFDLTSYAGATDNLRIRNGTADTDLLTILATGNVGIGTASPEATLDVTGTDAMILPRGTTAQQPAGGDSVNGMIRYDTDVDKFQAYQGGTWQDILTTASGNIIDDSLDWDKFTDTMTLDADTVIDMDSGNFDLTFDDDSNTLHIDSENNRIGIGTNTPGMSLDVVGRTRITTNANQELVLNSGALEETTINFRSNGSDEWQIASSSDGTGMFFYSYGLGDSVMRLVDNGRVGIGTNSPSYKLDVEDISTATSGTVYNTRTTMEANPGGATTALYRGQFNRVRNTSGNNTDLSQVMATLNYAQNTGTGTFTAAFAGRNVIANTSTGDIGTAYGLSVDLVNSGGGTVTNYYGVHIADDDASATNAYAIYTDGVAPSYFGGNVGIGTTTPRHKLSIGSGMGFSWGDNNIIHFNSYWDTTDSRYESLTNGYSGLIWYDKVGGALRIGTGTTSATGADEAANINTARLSIDNAGNVGIGTPAPEATLDVGGTDAMILPRGTTAQQPAGGDSVNGMIRYDTDVDKFQAYQGGAWQDILTTASGNIIDDSIDWDKISDTMTLDATTTIDMTAGDLNFDSATLFIDSTNNRIGIGNAAPSSILDINSSCCAGINLEMQNFTYLGSLKSGAATLLGFNMKADADDNNRAVVSTTHGSTGYAGITIGTTEGRTGSNIQFWTETGAVTADDNITTNSPRMIIDTSGNVGIGTTAPRALLTLNKGIGNLYDILNIFGNSSSAFFSVGQNNTSSVIAAASTGSDNTELTFQTSAAGTEAEAMRINSAGNIGIGTADIEAWNSTYRALQLGDNALMFNPLDDQIYLTTNAYFDGAWKYRDTDTAARYDQVTGYHSFSVAASGTANAAISWTEAMRITNAGNVGIGASSPTYKLVVQDTSTATSGTDYTSYNVMFANPGGATTANYRSRYNLVRNTSGNNTDISQMMGVQNNAYYDGTGTVTSTYGGYNVTNNAGTGDITNAYANYGYALNSSTGDITNAYGAYSQARNVSTGGITNATGAYGLVTNLSTGTITNAFGLRSDLSNPSGTVTNYYGLYVNDDVANATNAYAIYTDGTMPSYFGGNVGIGTTSPNRPLHILQSSAIGIKLERSGHDSMDISNAGGGLLIENSTDLTDLFLVQNTGRVGIGTVSPAATLDISATDAMILPRGTTAQQPAGGDSVNGMIRYDTDVDKFQAYQAGAWQDILTTASGNITDDSLDWDKFSDTMTMDAATTITMADGNDLTIDSADNTLHIDSTNNRVGIGTNAPTSKLYVDGDIELTRNNMITSYNAARGTFGFIDVYDSSTGNIEIGTTFGTGDVILSPGASGNVGIGTATPSQELDVFASTAVIAQFLRDLTTDTGIRIDADNAGAEIKTVGNHNLDFFTDDTERVRIDSTGNVGIGTTSPGAKLDILGTNPVSRVVHDGGATAFTQATASIVDMGASSNHPMRLLTNNTEALRIDTSQNIGIGTTSPSSKVHISTNTGGSLTENTYGVVLEDSSTSQTAPTIAVIGKRSDGNASQTFGGGLALAGLRTDDAVATNKRLGTIYFGGNHTDGTQANIAYSASISGIAEGAFSDASTMPTGIAFHTGSTGDWLPQANQTYGTERMRIDADGNVGIGTTSPAAPLHVHQPGVNGIALSRDGHETFNIALVGSNRLAFKNVTDSTQPFVISDDGRIGIGTITPEATLDVVGTDAMIVPRGTTAQQPAGGDSVNGMLRYDTDVDKFQAYQGGTWQDILTSASGNIIDDSLDWDKFSDTMTMDAATTITMADGNDLTIDSADNTFHIDSTNNRVGIGTTSPARAFHLYTADAAMARFESDNGEWEIYQHGLLGTSTATNARTMLELIDQDTLSTRAVMHLKSNAGATDVLWAGADGNVGIGTAAPVGDLHVYGTDAQLRLQDDGDASSYFAIVDAAPTQTVISKVVDAGAALIDTSPAPQDGSSGASVRFFRTTNTTGTKVLQLHKGDASATVEAQIGVDGADSYFTGGGNVGIGTASPGAPLHVLAPDPVPTFGGSFSTLILDKPDNSWGGINFAENGTGQFLIRTNTADSLVFTIEGTPDIIYAMTLDSEGDLGIGTSTPLRKLTVQGDAVTSGEHRIIGVQTSNGNESISLGYDADGSIHSNAFVRTNNSRPLHFGTNTTPSAMAILDNGNVGIGTTAPEAALHIDGALRFEQGGGFNYDTIIEAADEGGISIKAADNIGDARSVLEIRDHLDNGLIHMTDGGRIGLNKESPETPLHINAVVSAGIVPLITLTSNDTTNPNVDRGVSVIFKTPATGANPAVNGAQIIAAGEGTTEGAAYLSFETATAGTLAEAMRITSAGNVGIGTTSPGEEFHVHAASDSDSVALFTTANTGTASTDGLYVGVTNSNSKGWVWNYENAGIGFGANNAEVMTLTADGLGIGDTTPDQDGDELLLLDVEGAMGAAYYCDQNGENCFQNTDVTSVTGGTLDWDNFADAMTLDATTTIDMAAGDLNFDGGTFYINSSSNFVGVGTDTPLATLHIENSTPGAANLRVNALGTSGSNTPGMNVFSEGTFESFFGYDEASDTTQVFGGGALAMSIDGSQNVGIGTGSPSTLFHVSTSGATSSGAAGGHNVLINRNSTVGMTLGTNSGGTGEIVFRDDAVANSGIIQYDHSDDSFGFFTNSSERLSILANGNVGIGTTSPSHALHVEGDNDVSLMLRTIGTDATDDTLLRLLIGGTEGNNYIYFGDNDDSNAGTIRYNHDDDSMRFTTGGTNEAMRITSTQQIGIGTTAPDSGALVEIQQTETNNISDAYYGLHVDYNYAPSSAITGNVSGYGIYSILDSTIDENGNDTNLNAGYFFNRHDTGNVGNDVNTLNGVTGLSYHQGSGTANVVRGAFLEGRTTNASGSVTTLIGSQSVARAFSSTASNAYGKRGIVYAQGATSSISNAYGVQGLIQELSSGTVTTGYALHARCEDAATCYGLYVDAGDAEVTTDWGIYTSGEDKNYFSGAVGIGTSTPTGMLDVVASTLGTDKGINLFSGTDSNGIRARIRTSNPSDHAMLELYDASETNTVELRSSGNSFLNAGNLTIGDTSSSDGSGSGGQALKLDVEGAIGGTHYCDEDGANCFTAAGIAGGLWNTGASSSINYTAGNVGVGTASPISKFHMYNGNMSVQTTSIYDEAGYVYDALDVWDALYSSNTNGGISVHAQNSTDVARWSSRLSLKSDSSGSPRGSLDFISRDEFNVETLNLEILTFHSNGNVGIGNTDPDALLDIETANRLGSTFTGGTIGEGVSVTQTDYVAGNYISLLESRYDDGSTTPDVRIGAMFDGGGSNLAFGTSNNYSTGITNEAMFIDSSGNIGMGTNAPGQKLQVSDGNVLVSNNNAYLYIDGTDNDSTSLALWLYQLSGGTAYMLNNTNSASTFLRSRTSGGTPVTGIGYNATYVALHSNDGAETMRVTGEQVGIGLTSPGATLSVAGTLGLSESGGSGDRLQISTSGSGTVINHNDNSDIIFQTQGSEHVRITSEGQVGIGTSSPTGNSIVEIESAATTNNTASYGLYVDHEHTPSGALTATTNSYGAYIIADATNFDLNGNTGQLIASHSYARNDNSDANGTDLSILTGASGLTIHDGSGTVATQRAVYGDARTNDAAGISTNLMGGQFIARTIGGNSTTARGVDAAVLAQGGTISAARGVDSFLNESSGGTITNGYAFYGDCNDATTCYGLYILAGDAEVTTDWGVYVAGEDKNYLSGSLGIGTTTPNALLEINADSNDLLRLDAGTSNYPTIAFYGNSGTYAGQIFGEGGTGSLYYDTQTTGNHVFRNQGTNLMFINDNGNVGIGTDAPSALLSIEKAGNSFLTTEGDIDGLPTVSAFIHNNTSNTNSLAGIGFEVRNDRRGYIGFTENSASYLSDFIIGTRTGANTFEEKIRVTGNGELGIGTATPTAMLTVKEASASTEAVIAEFLSSTDRAMRILQPDTADGNDPFTFTTNNAYTFRVDAVDALNIEAGGEVGIGTTAPSSELHVHGGTGTAAVYVQPGAANFDANIGFRTSANAAAGWVGYDESQDTIGLFNTTTFAGATAGIIIDNTGNVGIGDTAPSHILEIAGAGRSTQSTWDTTSDVRVKTNIETIQTTSALEHILQLRPVTFDYTDSYKADHDGMEGTRRGFIAQEVAAIDPAMVELVTETVDGMDIEDFHVLKNNDFTPLLVSAVQELDKQNESLEERLDNLEEQVENLNKLGGAMAPKASSDNMIIAALIAMFGMLGGGLLASRRRV